MRYRNLGLLVLIWACAEPVASSPCACDPFGPVFELLGTLVSAAGTPQPSMRIRARTSPLPCNAFVDNPIVAHSDSVGAVRLPILVQPSDSMCVRILVRDDIAGTPELELPGTLRLRTPRPPYAAVTVPLVLSP